MKIYISHSREIGFQKALYQPLRQSKLNSEYTFILPHEETSEPYETKKLFSTKGCDLVIAEVSYPSTSQGIELGWADMFDIPIICIYKDGIKPSSSLSAVSNKMLMYTSTENMIEDITGVLTILS